MSATISKKKNQVYQIPDCEDKRMHFRREQLQSFRVTMTDSKYGTLGLALSRDDNTLPKQCAASPQAKQALLLDTIISPAPDCEDLRMNFRWERRRSFRIALAESKYGKLGLASAHDTLPKKECAARQQASKQALSHDPDCRDLRMSFCRERHRSFRVAMAESKYGKLGLTSAHEKIPNKKCATCQQAAKQALSRNPEDCKDLRMNFRRERHSSFRIAMVESKYGTLGLSFRGMASTRR